MCRGHSHIQKALMKFKSLYAVFWFPHAHIDEGLVWEKRGKSDYDSDFVSFLTISSDVLYNHSFVSTPVMLKSENGFLEDLFRTCVLYSYFLT